MAFVDERTLQALDFPQIRSRLAAYAQSERGALLCAELVPDGDWRRAARISAAVDEMRSLIGSGFGLDPIPATDSALAKARRGVRLSAPELGDFARALHSADAAVRTVRAAGPAALELQRIAEPARSFRELSEDLQRAFGGRGEILDTASTELKAIRRAKVGALDGARARATAIAGSQNLSKALQDAIITQRGDRFVLPIKADFAGKVPGIVHDSSASGQTIFVEPLGVIEANNRVRTLALDEQHEIDRILHRFGERIGAQATMLAHLFSIAVELDGLYARARLAIEMHALATVYRTPPGLRLCAARHPLLRGPAVPQTLALDAEQALIIISGPNMGGKTVALKLVALFVVMAACGMHVPAESGTEIGPFTGVIAEIGDAQSLAADSSTFAAHLRRLRSILEAAEPGLLFVVDEIASGTETSAGAALARALLDELLDAGAMGIVTTHAQELKTYAQDRTGAVNGGMRFQPDSHEPTFELDIGVPGRSLALDLAAREGFPSALLAAARDFLGPSESAYDQALAELSRSRAELALAERRFVAEEHAQRMVRSELERERRDFALQRAQLLAAAEAELRAVIDAFGSELRARTPATTTRVGRSHIEALGAARGRVEQALRDPAPGRPTGGRAPLKLGMTVEIAGFEQPGTILELSGTQVVVALGALRMTVERSLVRPAPAAAKTSVRNAQRVARRDAQVHEAQLERVQTTQLELDVRGQRVHEALPLVEQWLDQAVSAGVSPVRLIHGKGTGALGTGLQIELRTHPRVTDIRYGNENEGGGGVSIISLH